MQLLHALSTATGRVANIALARGVCHVTTPRIWCGWTTARIWRGRLTHRAWGTFHKRHMMADRLQFD
jgi:hypothetical protein